MQTLRLESVCHLEQARLPCKRAHPAGRVPGGLGRQARRVGAQARAQQGQSRGEALLEPPPPSPPRPQSSGLTAVPGGLVAKKTALFERSPAH